MEFIGLLPQGNACLHERFHIQKTSYGGKKTIEWREDMGASKDLVLPFPNGHPLPRRSRIRWSGNTYENRKPTSASEF